MTAKKILFLVLYTKGTVHFSMVEAPNEFNKDLEQEIVVIDKK